MEKKISIQREKVLTAYERASEEQKALLENMFGKDVFQPKNIMERVKTFEDACGVLGEDHQYVKAYREWMRIYYAECTDVTAYLKLRIIVEALNEGWKPDFTNNEEYRYYPYLCLWSKEELEQKTDAWKDERNLQLWIGGGNSSYGAYCGLASAYSYSAWSLALANFSARLAHKTEELAIYSGKQFTELWANYTTGKEVTSWKNS